MNRITAVVLGVLVLGGVAGCRTSAEEVPAATPTPPASIAILSPGPSSRVDAGQTVSVQVVAKDELGVGTIELYVDNELIDSAVVPSGTPAQSYETFLFWTAGRPGTHTLEVRSYSTDGTPRSSVRQPIQITESPAVVYSSPRSAPVARPTAPPRRAANLRGPTIRYFRSTPAEARPGDTITLEWDAPGATRGFLYTAGAKGQEGPPQEVLPQGTLDYRISPSEQGPMSFTLSVLDNAGRQAEETITVALRGSGIGADSGCREWFFSPAPEECARAAIKSYGAQEHFENGVMIWVQEIDTIYVLYDDGTGRQWETYRDEFEEGDPEFDPTIEAPEGLHQPIRGFGLLWRTNAQVRGRLGWAVDREVGAPTAVQSTARGSGETTYLKNLYSGVYQLEPDGTWTFIPEPEEGTAGIGTPAGGESGATATPNPIFRPRATLDLKH